MCRPKQIADLPEELLDQVHVSHDHSSAAIPTTAELIHRITRRLLDIDRAIKGVAAHTHRQRRHPAFADTVPKDHRRPGTTVSRGSISPGT